MRHFLLMTCALALSGCSTASFAPPNVNFAKEVSFSEGRHHCGGKTIGNDLGHNVDGARRLIDNFISSYRCAAHSAADGRQAFEVPSFLGLTGAAAAAALGAGTTLPVLVTAGNGILNGGKAYYSPQQKADMYDSALDALLCIKTEAIGIDALTIGKISLAQAGQGAGGDAGNGQGNQKVVNFANLLNPDPEVSVAASKQYFDLIASSLLSVERVLSQRLSAAGTPFDPEGVIAQIKALTEEKEETETDAEGTAQAEADALAGNADAAAAVAEAQANATTDPTQKGMFSAVAAVHRANAAQAATFKDTIIKLKTLKPKLEECVVRAKV